MEKRTLSDIKYIMQSHPAVGAEVSRGGVIFVILWGTVLSVLLSAACFQHITNPIFSERHTAIRHHYSLLATPHNSRLAA